MPETVLFVDDEQICLDFVKILFNGKGLKIITARFTLDALDIVRAEPVSVVVADHQMPALCGLEFLSIVKEISPMTVRIIMTGTATLPTLVAARDAGELFRLVGKPCKNEALVRAVKDGIRRYRKEEKVEEPTRILIAEDEFLSRKLLMTFLAPYGELDVAVNGMEAVNAFDQALADGRNYRLMCLDIMMPEIDGREVLKIIRQKEKEAGIPPSKETKIIMTTALRTPRDVFEAFYLGGCTSYLPKPIERKALTDRLTELGMEPSR